MTVPLSEWFLRRAREHYAEITFVSRQSDAATAIQWGDFSDNISQSDS
jgi:hypothetical protein